ncbi:DUF342 domain-containing protein [Paenibacillus piri]|uniref:DUF342 domain-containing protein n=1 Tax=Paenibacillus piri TaxID=2547395 RepID=A0A4R5KKY2_9BACL|nr:FapA family protein [Paenibacillus piri]TDF95515.1 DUF342 domain-containing protein [Paenibacillus piri]
MEIYANSHFRLVAEEKQVYIVIDHFDYKLQQFIEVVKEVPRLQITLFGNLRKAFATGLKERIEIGILKPLIELTFDKEYMRAAVKLNMTGEQFMLERSITIEWIRKRLAENGVTEGILEEVLEGGLQVQVEQGIAKGCDPLHGEDAKIRYFQLSDRVPSIRQNGSVDHYELSFIDEVREGDWLGEKMMATTGMPGRNLRGEVIRPKRGKDKPLLYDRSTIKQVREVDKLVLRARQSGVVQMKFNQISVMGILTIDGDVGPKTGNIQYDGSVKVTGTVLDGYSVHATRDISIMSDSGIGMVNRIISETGDIFIKGGVFGKNRACIEAGGRVFVKHANDCSIKSKDSIHIGLYSIGSRLSAKYITLDRNRGKIIGGHVNAGVQVVAGYIGNEMERETTIQIDGFDRLKLKTELEAVLCSYRQLLIELGELSKAEESENGEQPEQEENDERQQQKEDIYLRINRLEERRSMLIVNLNAKGEGEISVVHKAFPRTLLQIKELERRIDKTTSGSYYFKENQIFTENII